MSDSLSCANGSTDSSCVLWGVSVTNLVISGVALSVAIFAPFFMYLVFAIITFSSERYHHPKWGVLIRASTFRWATWLFRFGLMWAAYVALDVPDYINNVLSRFITLPFIFVWFLFTNSFFDAVTAVVAYEFQKRIADSTTDEQRKNHVTVSAAAEEGIRVTKYIGFIVIFIVSCFIEKIDIYPLIEGGSAISLGLVFASQPWLRNLFGGIFVFADTKYVLGDQIIIAGQRGKVEGITLRRTKIRLPNNSLAHIPNVHSLTASVVNCTARQRRLLSLRFKLSNQTPVKQLREVLLAIESVLRTLHPQLTSHLRTSAKWTGASNEDGVGEGRGAGEGGETQNTPFLVVMDKLFEILVWTYTYGEALEDRAFSQIRNELYLAVLETFERLNVKCVSHSCSLEQAIDNPNENNNGKNDSYDDKNGVNQGLLSTGPGFDDAIYAVSALSLHS